METEIFEAISNENKDIIKEILNSIDDIEILRKQEVAYRINIVIERMKKMQKSTIKSEDFTESDLVGLNENTLKTILKRLNDRKKQAEGIVDAQKALYDKIKKEEL